jgi:hypothetical protein
MSKLPGHEKCKCSSGIHEDDNWPGFTFGSGHLDKFGYWEKPCFECARNHEKQHSEDGKCWPFDPDNWPVELLGLDQSV